MEGSCLAHVWDIKKEAVWESLAEEHKVPSSGSHDLIDPV